MTQDLIEDPAITAVTSRETEPGVTESGSTSGAALGASLVAAAALAACGGGGGGGGTAISNDPVAGRTVVLHRPGGRTVLVAGAVFGQ